MADQGDQETLPEINARQLAEKTAWVRVFLREARKRGHTIEDIISLLDEPGMTVLDEIVRTQAQLVRLQMVLARRTKQKIEFNTGYEQ